MTFFNFVFLENCVIFSFILEVRWFTPPLPLKTQVFNPLSQTTFCPKVIILDSNGIYLFLVYPKHKNNREKTLEPFSFFFVLFFQRKFSENKFFNLILMSQPSTTNTTTNTTRLRTLPAAPKKTKAVATCNRLQVTCRRRLEVTTSSSTNIKTRVSKKEMKLSGGATWLTFDFTTIKMPTIKWWKA